ncbi:MAG: amidase [Planctomycetota bacterium]
MGIDRRRFLRFFAATGLGGTLFPGALWAQARPAQGEARGITIEAIQAAEEIAGISFSSEEREQLRRELSSQVQSYEELRKLHLPNDVAPALLFDPAPPGIVVPPAGVERLRMSRAPSLELPSGEAEIAFLPVTTLSRLLRAKAISSVELTNLYLKRLEKYGPLLKCVVSLTRELALKQAVRADQEIAEGMFRSPLHGIPWGAKDLFAVRDYKTTWGAAPYQDQVILEDATVVRRLEEAGAVLVAKLTLGALAMGDTWFGGRTLCPWNLKAGSSGSSAGPGAATAAGLVGFAIGTETRGSIVSPSTRNGNSSLRPSFGRVSRQGAMALSWSMDKIGPMCRSAEDCALVFSAIHGADGRDPVARSVPFDWDGDRPAQDLRVGYLKSGFKEGGEGRDPAHDREVLRVLEEDLALDLIEVELPEFPTEAMDFILTAEAAAAFDDLTLSNRDDLLTRQDRSAWPNTFRAARFIPAVEYIQANRARTVYMRLLAEALRSVDVFVTPSFASGVLGPTNLSGQPTVVVPNGFSERGMPGSISFVGGLYQDSEALLLAHAYQQVTEHHLRRPDLDALPDEGAQQEEEGG